MMKEENLIRAPKDSLTALGRFFFKRRRLALALVLIVGVTTPMLLAFNWSQRRYLIPLELATKFLMFYPAVRANCRWFGRPVIRFRTATKAVWLTIDDGPHPEDTPELLKLLKKYNARATFFVIGRQVQQHPALARAILHDGHTLANHSQTHPVLLFWCFLRRQLAPEVDQCSQILRETTGMAPRWFRAPAGMANLFLHFLLCDRKMNLIGWSARGFDGLLHDPEAMARRILKSTRTGTMVLLHEGRRDARGRPINLLLVETILSRLTAEGYVCIVPNETDFS